MIQENEKNEKKKKNPFKPPLPSPSHLRRKTTRCLPRRRKEGSVCQGGEEGKGKWEGEGPQGEGEEEEEEEEEEKEEGE